MASDLISEVILDATWRLSRLEAEVFLPVELFAEVFEVDDCEAEGTAAKEAVEVTDEAGGAIPEAVADSEAVLDVARPPAPPPVEAVKLFLMKFCSKLLLEPADMSLAGPVAEVRDIFSGSNSAGPK